MKSLAASFLLFVLALAAFDASFRVEPGQLAVVTSPINGVRNNLATGLHLKWPLLDHVQRVPARVVLQPDVRETTSDGRELVQSPWLLARVTDAAEYAEATRANPAAPRDRIAAELQSTALPALHAQTFPQALVDRGQAVWTNNATLDTAAGKLGLKIEDRGDAGIGIATGSPTAAAIQSGMRTSQDVVIARARVDAQAQLQAAKAQADAARAQLLAEARKSADARRADGEAEAARIYAEAAGDDPQAAAFDRAAMAYRRARVAGKPVSLDDPAFQALRYAH
ncbi:SPFH domain-containing protein [Solilutibacter silvestris]|uniref:SPFH domain-containing protein n=1 Tax=Solilutibacter silvestris TaxID=1645665 RepID=A0A2K1Q3W0_9GAMM|nr:SPFH domain-containing protein [Lysobacter silvestris]PNS09691.1 SPFH domain-containing protein [Lysobacter silvestris]